MRVRAGPTAIVVLIAAVHVRAYADSTSMPNDYADPKTSACAARPAAPLFQTVATKKSRAQLSDFLVALGRAAFALGRAAFAARQYGDALVYFHVGDALAPELPGLLREPGATYDELGAAEAKRAFYRRYLVQRPIGANADHRGRLGHADRGADGADRARAAARGDVVVDR